jgi:LytS/YehU family sensor histidine kinase
MVCALSDLLRRILHMSERPEIQLQEELEFAHGYLAVHRIRFEDALRVSWHIDPKANEAIVPTLLLQPLIENALEHGLRGDPGEIAIGAEIHDHRLLLSVTDRADEPLQETSAAHNGTRVGLRNTHERLRTIFGSDYRLDLVVLPDGSRAEIEFPFRINPI